MAYGLGSWGAVIPLKIASVKLDDDTLTCLGQMVEVMDRPHVWLMAEAIMQYVTREEWVIYKVETNT
ncbi:MAG: putative transcriptional regulator [Candidatus Endobugula sp.]|jgi:predicted transcriptional regulator